MPKTWTKGELGMDSKESQVCNISTSSATVISGEDDSGDGNSIDGVFYIISDDYDFEDDNDDDDNDPTAEWETEHSPKSSVRALSRSNSWRLISGSGSGSVGHFYGADTAGVDEDEDESDDFVEQQLESNDLDTESRSYDDDYVDSDK